MSLDLRDDLGLPVLLLPFSGFLGAQEGEAAGVVRIYDITISDISLVDWKSQAVAGTALVMPADGQIFQQTKPGAGKRQLAARSSSAALSNSPLQAFFDVSGAESKEIEPTELAPTEDRPLSPAERWSLRRAVSIVRFMHPAES